MHTTHDAFLSLDHAAQQTMIADAYERPDIEACGVLLGTIDTQGNWLVTDALALPNSYASPVYFEFAPEDLLQVELEYPGQVVGVYHSHPTGYPHASSTDCQNMQRVNSEQGIPWVWIIVLGPFHPATPFTQALATLPTSLLAFYHDSETGLAPVPIYLNTPT